MNKNLLHPILITIITIGSLRTEEKRNDLFEGDFLLWFILIAFIISWVVFFTRKSKKREE